MKKNIFLFAIVFFCFIPFLVSAETKLDSTANVNVVIDQSDNSADNYDYGSREFSFPYIGRMDSSSTFGPQPIYNLEKLGDMRGLPADWAKMGWRVLEMPNRLVAEGIPMKVLDKSRASWIDHRVNETGYPVVEKADGRVYPVNFFPKDGSALPVMHSKSYADKEKHLPSEAQYEAIYHGAKSGAKFFVVLYNIHYLSKTKNLSIGTTMVGNAAVGPTDLPGKHLLSGGGGSGWGTAQSWVWERGGYWVIFFDQRPIPNISQEVTTIEKSSGDVQEVREISATEEPRSQETQTRPALKPTKIPSVMFDYDSARLYKQDQIEAISTITDAIAKMIPDLDQSGRIIRIIGGASREGEYGYNLPLSDNRARAVHKAVAQRLYKNHNVPAATIQKVLHHAAIGENYPDYDKINPDSRNRRVYFEIADRISE